jgi:VanZ family protein
MLVIFFLSSLPSSRIPYYGAMDLLIKKGGHALGFGLLGLAYAYALPPRLSAGPRWLISLIMVLLFALSDEFHQSFVEGRNSSVIDVFIDITGASVALTIGVVYSSNSRSKSSD